MKSRGLRRKRQDEEIAAGDPLTTYDSGYEFSPEHWIELQRLVEDEDENEEEEHLAPRRHAG